MIEQTLFALPFAYMGILFAGGGTPAQWLWATLALFGARTAGMSFNRVLDARIDAKNPRTAGRHIPAGELSVVSVWLMALMACAVLVGSSYMLNRLCFYLSFVAVALLFTYSFFKRFSASSHFYLGFVEAAAPVGGYLAVTGAFAPMAFMPGMAIMFWIAGLDILYAMQDMDHDRQEGLFSIPARYGREKALVLSGASYVLALASLTGAGIMAGLGLMYWTAVSAVAFIFFRQQALARTEGQELQASVLQIFSLNRFISPVIFIGMFMDAMFRNLFR